MTEESTKIIFKHCCQGILLRTLHYLYKEHSSGKASKELFENAVICLAKMTEVVSMDRVHLPKLSHAIS